MGKWVKSGEYAIKTETHAICKAMVRGAWVYTLYQLPDTMLGNYPSVQAAKWELENNG